MRQQPAGGPDWHYLATMSLVPDQNHRVVLANQLGGTVVVHSITGTATNNQRFPSQHFDQETGYHYNYFRDYDPTTGQYVESDPIGLRGGLNTYRYVGGNPLYWIDPLGLAVEFCSAPADIAYGFVDHVWLKTGTKEAGAQGAAQNAGDEYEAPYFTELAITDHSGNSKTRKGARCEIVPNVDESLVNELLEIGKPLGQFSAFNKWGIHVITVKLSATGGLGRKYQERAVLCYEDWMAQRTPASVF